MLGDSGTELLFESCMTSCMALPGSFRYYSSVWTMSVLLNINISDTDTKVMHIRRSCSSTEREEP